MKYTINGKELTLTYNMSTWLAIEESAGKRLHEVIKDLDGPNRVRSMMILLIALAHDETVTAEWLDENMAPTFQAFQEVCTACTKAIAEGMKTEKGNDEPADVGLAELEKKEGPGT